MLRVCRYWFRCVLPATCTFVRMTGLWWMLRYKPSQKVCWRRKFSCEWQGPLEREHREHMWWPACCVVLSACSCQNFWEGMREELAAAWWQHCWYHCRLLWTCTVLACKKLSWAQVLKRDVSIYFTLHAAWHSLWVTVGTWDLLFSQFLLLAV